MRPTHFLTTALIALLVAACGGSEEKPKPRAAAAKPAFSTNQVSTFFKDVTGDPLEATPSTAFDSLTPARGDYHRASRMAERYGSFMIFVLRRPGSERVYKTEGGQPVTPDVQGVYWHGSTAMKPYKNVVLSWEAEQQAVDERFQRLDSVLSQLGKPAEAVRAALPPEDQPCGAEPTGTCRDASGATVTTVERGERLELPNLQVRVVKVDSGRVAIPPRDYGLTRRAKGRFVMALMRILNTGDEPLRSLHDVKLKIGEKIYDQSSEATWTVNPIDSFPLQPDDSTVAAVVFDLPVDAAREALDSGVLAFPAGDDLSTVEDAARLGQIRLGESGGSLPAPSGEDATNS